MFGPDTSWNLGVTHTVVARGGEHGQIAVTVVDIALSNSKEVAARVTMQLVSSIQQLVAFPMSGRSGRVPGTRE